MYYRSNEIHLHSILRKLPHAVAVMQGGPRNRYLGGTVKFYQTGDGVLVVADILGLPEAADACSPNVFAFHIHGGGACTRNGGGNSEDPFADAGSHYNPSDCPHPYHAGDMPPLFSAGDRAFLAFISDRFTVDEIIGKTVIIHDRPDDFTTQPSGNAGNKIACGVIFSVRR